MNKKQRLVLAIFVPIMIFFITLTIANYVGIAVSHSIEKVSFRTGGPEYTFNTTSKNYNPFDWQKTWYVWIIFSIFCCIFEYKLFAGKKIIINKKKDNDLI
ncbi:hypothetical protein CVT91_03430 [Candidatus Atribacteria bacterium HGW-Atribacteria-1]|nr:MAG: hypothetical protein CVT91_03430 [Candidatus Atribacteria bacterium HGW-Atribacteria-1]